MSTTHVTDALATESDRLALYAAGTRALIEAGLIQLAADDYDGAASALLADALAQLEGIEARLDD